MKLFHHRSLGMVAAAAVGLSPSTVPAAPSPTYVPQRLNAPYAPGNTDVVLAQPTADGSRVLYFQRSTAFNTHTLRAVGIAPGATPATLHPPTGADFDRYFLRSTPDGSRVIAQSEGVLYSMPVDGSPPAALGRPTRLDPFAISPDGSSVAFFIHLDEDAINFERLAISPTAGDEPVLIPGGVRLGHWMSYSIDGSTILFQGAPAGSSGATGFLYAAPIDGSSPAALLVPAPGQPDVPAEASLNPVLLPDGSGIVYSTESEMGFNFDTVRKLDFATGEATTLFASPSGARVFVTLSENGSAVLITESFTNLHHSNVATGEVTTLATGVQGLLGSTITPDGSHAIIRNLNQIISQALDGSPPVVLSESAVVEIEALDIIGVTPDSSRVVFWANIDGRNPQLFSNTLDGSNLVRLNGPLDLLEGIEFDARISVDGSHVLFRADTVVEGDDYLFRVPVEGGTPEQLHANSPAAGDVDFFVENPDGSGAAFIADLVTNSIDELFYRDYGAVAPHAISDRETGDGRLSGFAISADSNFVVYRAQQFEPGTDELVSVTSTGGSVRRLNAPPTVSGDVGFKFELTSDGARAVFMADSSTNTVHELFSGIVNQGGPPIKLHPPLDGNRDVWDFSISPDGQHVAVLGDIDINRRAELFLAAIDGSTFVKVSPELVGNSDINSDFTFSPDGQWLVFTGPINGTSLFLYHVPTGDRSLIEIPGTRPFLSTFGPAFSPDSRTFTFEAFNGTSTRFIYRIDSGSLINLGPENAQASRHDFSSDSRFLVWAEANRLRTADLTTLQVMAPLDQSLANTLSQQFAITPHTHRIVAVSRLPSEVQVLSTTMDGAEIKVIHQAPASTTIRAIQIAAGGRIAVFSADQWLYRANLVSDQPAERVNLGYDLVLGDRTFATTPDGDVVYFLARPEGNVTTTPGLFRFDRSADAGSQIIAIVEPGSGATGAEAPIELTPDGRQLVFASDHLTPGVRDLFSTLPGVGIAHLKPAASDQDALESTILPGLTDITAPEAVFDGSHWNGLRFEIEGIAPGTRINRALLTFTASSTTDLATRELLIRAQADPNALAFAGGQPFDIINRPPIPASPVIWPLTEWTAGQRYVSPDITPLLEGVMQLSGWQDPGSIVFTILSRGGAGGEAHRSWFLDGDPTLAPELQIDLVSPFDERLPFDSWASNAGVPAPERVPELDLDGDGLPLIIEYAFGLDPNSPESSPAPSIGFSQGEDGQLYPTVQFRRQIGATSAMITLEASSDLERWRAIASTTAGAPAIALSPDTRIEGETDLGAGSILVTLSLDTPAATLRARHFRFRVKSLH